MEDLKDGEYNKILSTCQGKQWYDDEFPPDENSLIKDWSDTDPEVQELIVTWKNYEWIRADKVACLNDDEGELSVFAGEIEPTIFFKELLEIATS